MGAVVIVEVLPLGELLFEIDIALVFAFVRQPVSEIGNLYTSLPIARHASYRDSVSIQIHVLAHKTITL